jgi:hypothetical protein
MQSKAGIASFLLESCCQRTLTNRGSSGKLRGAMSKDKRRLPDRLDWDNLAADALELSRLMPPGRERDEALKLASPLRCTADVRGGKPRK